MTLRKSIILYGMAMAVLIGILKFAEYRFYVRDLSLELYLGLVAVIFVGPRDLGRQTTDARKGDCPRIRI